MFYRKNKITLNDTHLYNNLLLLSRSKLLYTKFGLKDTFQNRINLIFIHASFLINKVKSFSEKEKFKLFNQKIFDLIFKKIEENMRDHIVGELARCVTLQNLYLDREEYEKCAIIKGRMDIVNKILKKGK